MGKIFRSETLRAESSLPRFKDIGDKLDVKNSFLREPFHIFVDEAIPVTKVQCDQKQL